MDYFDLIGSIEIKAKKLGLIIKEYGSVFYDKEYKFIQLRKKGDNEKFIVISAGIHGEEISGPITIAERLEEIVDYAKDFSLVIYPCTNPSAFNKQRYNLENEHPNNDHVRYFVNDKWIDDLEDKNEFDNWLWSSQVVKLPKETELLQASLKELPSHFINGFLDLHQDIEMRDYGTYAYVMDKKELYAQIMERASKIVPVLNNKEINSGQKSPSFTDELGFVKRHDGSLQDLMHRLGVPYTVTVETTNIEMEKAIDVNMTWIKGIIELCL